MKIVKKILIALLVVLVIAQFFSPDKNTGDTKDLTAFLEETNPNEEVKAILKILVLIVIVVIQFTHGIVKLHQ